MTTKIVRIHALWRKPKRAYRDDSPQGINLDMLTLRAMAERVVDVDADRQKIAERRP